MSVPDGGDASLDLPSLPVLDRELGPLAFPPLSGGAPAPVVVGGSARVMAGPAGLAMEADGGVIVDRLRLDGATPGLPRTTPLGIERKLASEHGTVTERVVVPFTGPVGLFEWTLDRPAPVRLEWWVAVGENGGEAAEYADGAGPLRWRVADRAVVVARGDRRALFVASEPGSFGVSPREGGLEVRYSAGPVGRVLLAVAGTLVGEEWRAVRVLGRAGMVVRGRESRVRRVLEERLALEASDPAPGRALAWAILALAPRESVAVPAGWTEAALAEAMLASGDAGPARRLIREALGDGPAGAPVLAVVARYLAWTGDRSTVAAVWDRVLESAEDLAGGPGLSRVAEDIGAAAPAVGGAAPEEIGTAALLEHLRGSTGPAGEAAARVLLLTALLGVVPDAPRGRLTLRPRIPDEWSGFRVRNLRVGGCAVEMSCDGDDGVVRYALRQTRGAPPLQVVFEPIVPARVRAARVDGVPAELAVAREGRSWQAPVQLVLDTDRTVELELAPDER